MWVSCRRLRGHYRPGPFFGTPPTLSTAVGDQQRSCTPASGHDEESTGETGFKDGNASMTKPSTTGKVGFTAMMGSPRKIRMNESCCHPVHLRTANPGGDKLSGIEKAQQLQNLITAKARFNKVEDCTLWNYVYMANVAPHQLVLCKDAYPDENLVQVFFDAFGINVTKNPQWRDAIGTSRTSAKLGSGTDPSPCVNRSFRDWHVVNLHRLILPAISDKHKALPPYSEFPRDVSRAPEELCVHRDHCRLCAAQVYTPEWGLQSKLFMLMQDLKRLAARHDPVIGGVTSARRNMMGKKRLLLVKPAVGPKCTEGFGETQESKLKYFTYAFARDASGEKAIGVHSKEFGPPTSIDSTYSKYKDLGSVKRIPHCRVAVESVQRFLLVVEDWYKTETSLIPFFDPTTETFNRKNAVDKLAMQYSSTTNSILVWLSCRGQSAQEHATRTAADGDQLSDKEKRLVAALQAESLRHQKETEEKWAATGEGSGATEPTTRVYVPVKLSVRVTVHTEDKLEHTYTVYGDDALEDVVQVTRSEKFRLGKEAKRKKDAERRETRGKVTLNIHRKISQPSKPPLLPDGLSLTVPLMERSWFKQDNLRFQESTDLVIQTMLRVAAPALHEMSERNRGGCKVVNVPSGAGNFTVPWYRAFDAKTVSAITGLESMGSMLKLSQKAKAKVIEEAATPLASNAPGNRPALNLLSIPAPGEAFDDAPNEIDLLVYRPFYSPPREARYAKDYPAPADAAHVEDTTRNLIKKTRPEIILMVLEDPSRAALFHHLTLLCRGVDGTEQGPPVYVPQEVTLVDTDPYGNWFYTVWLLRRADTLPYLPPLPPKRPRTSGRTQIHVHVEGKRMNLVVGGTDRLSEDPSFTTLAVSSSSRQSDGFPSGSGLKE